MAPLEDMAELVARQFMTCPSGSYYRNGYCYPNSSWYYWGRWVFAAVVIAVILGIAILLACLNARRRRARGIQPRYGTGWFASGRPGGPAPPYGNNYAPPPPQYSPHPQNPQYTGNTFNSNEGYYGRQDEGIQLEPPSNTYFPGRGGEPVYEPPKGPPPSKM